MTEAFDPVRAQCLVPFSSVGVDAVGPRGDMRVSAKMGVWCVCLTALLLPRTLETPHLFFTTFGGLIIPPKAGYVAGAGRDVPYSRGPLHLDSTESWEWFALDVCVLPPPKAMSGVFDPTELVEDPGQTDRSPAREGREGEEKMDGPQEVGPARSDVNHGDDDLVSVPRVV